ncbi:hypothetical protein K492DRAFT_165719 [Lichtheimia hyalospora FSU 10163]|nr:hypothetical protein K492DRAFT_165719 [Lichtheimia hyalospora FSU 10163]
MGLFGEFTSLNFSLYGQWLVCIGSCDMVVLIVLGIIGFMSHIAFSIVGWVIALILLFVEVPLCIKFCPTSPKFFAIVMFLSNIISSTSLNACAVVLLLGAICYAIAAIRGQSFASSRLLGGTGVSNVKLATLRGEVETANARAQELEQKVEQLEEEHSKKDENLEELQSRAKLLEEQLEKAEADLKEASDNFREADLRAEQLEKKEIKLKQEVKEWEKKNAQIEAKHKEVRDELDEMESQLEGV